MERTFFKRHCYAKTEIGQTHYYAVYGKDTVEVNKDVYDCLKQSYEREWSLERLERKHKAFSLEQLAENIELTDRHGALPSELRFISAEDEFFNEVESCRIADMLSRFHEEIQSLSSEDRMILETFLTGIDGTYEAAHTLGISERTVYNRRQRLAKQIARKLMEGYEE